MRVPLQRKVLNENDRIAGTLRERFHRNGTFCLNLAVVSLCVPWLQRRFG
jgi:hypothetical protein